MKIAIIGAGISGLTTAYLLNRHHDIHLYEHNNYIGGHTATVDIDSEGKSYAIDTGFIVCNDWTYPNFLKLMDLLSVETQASEMGFSVTSRHDYENDFEYCGSSLSGLFADRSNLINPKFLTMLFDIKRFNRIAKADFQNNKIKPGTSLQEYLLEYSFGEYFREKYIVPMASAIWSASTSQVYAFDALFFIRFFCNHGLLNISSRPQWRVIKGGSREYIAPLVASFRDKIRLGTPVHSVKRSKSQVTIVSDQGEDKFDQVVFACHSDQALQLLEQPTDLERKILGAIPYRPNSVVLHSDESLLPRRKTAWASWNYLLDGNQNEKPVLTYNMNMLQGIKSQKTFCVTVNGDEHIDPVKVIQKFNYSHPQFGAESVNAQNAWMDINGKSHSWFCGAYWGNGFHEDAVVSAQRVSKSLEGDTL
jgi:predicted NAD/FAD-binding protein